MKYKYQTTTVKSFAEENEIPNNAGQVLLVHNEQDCKGFNFATTLEKKLLESIQGKKNEVFVSYGDAKQIILTIGNDKDENLRKLGAELYTTILNEESNFKIESNSAISEQNYYSLLEGILLSSYTFDRHKKIKVTTKATFYIHQSEFSKDKIKELQVLSEATSLTKTLVNEPLNFMGALDFSKVAVEMGETYGFETEILDKKQIEDLKMGGLLAVNRGSKTPPTFNIFTYKPKNPLNKKPIVLVGKGVMFDTGGYSLKVSGSMTGMKSDMGGGASVLGAISAIAGNDLPYHVIGLVPATDNKIDSGALVVDDVITAMDGTTIEILNTDAEGRLVLCDALAYAKRYDPELVIDVATLTGASAAITGDFGIAMAGNTDKVMDELIKCGDAVYERLFKLPFWEEYSSLLKSDIADMTNLGGKTGGATTAGKFLEHFTDYPWVHLDVAGIAYIDSNKDYRQSGGTSAPVRLLYNFIKSKITND